jgi:hypothetical protein
VIPLETFPLVEWHEGELADVPSFTVLKTQICVTRPQCVNVCYRLTTGYEVLHIVMVTKKAMVPWAQNL